MHTRPKIIGLNIKSNVFYLHNGNPKGESGELVEELLILAIGVDDDHSDMV